MTRKIFRSFILTIGLILTAIPSHATLSTDLQELVSRGHGLQEQLAAIQVGEGSTCTQLGTLNTSIEDYLARISSITASITSAVTLTSADTTSLDELSTLARTMAADSVRLSWELRNIEDLAQLFEYRAGLSAMLRLSDDIGKMADRILEMADRILVMANNIGSMADRILITQQLQSSNMAFTQASILTTQTNMIALSDSLYTIAYNLSLGLIKSDATQLNNDMLATTLDSSNMASQLATLEVKTTALLNATDTLFTLISQGSASASHFINGDTLTQLADLSILYKALAFSLESYAATINQLAPLTATPILSDATSSMLRLTSDIGKMSGRIMEMSDKIIVMADNIGLMADRITETQNLQLSNLTLTQESLLTAQKITVTAIGSFL